MNARQLAASFATENVAALESIRTAPTLTADTIVYWPADGSRGRFGDLMMQDRKVVSWDTVRGEYVGDYGF